MKEAPIDRGSTDYLHECYNLHGELSQRCYQRRQELEQVEKAAKRIRSSRRLTYDDLQVIINPVWWDAGEFWRWPTREQVEPTLHGMSWDFWNLSSGNEAGVIRALFDIFRYIEPVSVVLRFIVPRNYGIISAPVEKVLEVRRSESPCDSYQNYLRDLRELRDTRGFKTAAEVDMALWVLQMGILGRRIDGREDMVERFRADQQLMRIRVRNLMGSLLQELDRGDLAAALLPINLQLAAEIGGIEFEKMVRRKCQPNSAGDIGSEEDLKDVIDDLHKRGMIDSLTKGRWHMARKIRNRAIHGPVSPGREEVDRLIKELGKRVA